MFKVQSSPMFTGRPQLTSTPLFTPSTRLKPSNLSVSPSNSILDEEKKRVTDYTPAEVINFLDANNLSLLVPKCVEAEIDGPLLASLCHPYLGSSIIQGMGIDKEDGERLVKAIKREMKE